jgi:hypothetical protein
LPKFLFVVTRQLPDVYDDLRRNFGGESGVDIIMDRRIAERRHRPGVTAQPASERRRAERRRNTRAADDLRAMGYAFIRVY